MHIHTYTRMHTHTHTHTHTDAYCNDIPTPEKRRCAQMHMQTHSTHETSARKHANIHTHAHAVMADLMVSEIQRSVMVGYNVHKYIYIHHSTHTRMQ